MVRREKPEVVVQMPKDCPISTAELAKQQEGMPWRQELQERLEDTTESLEDLKALIEGRMTMDGAYVL